MSVSPVEFVYTENGEVKTSIDENKRMNYIDELNRKLFNCVENEMQRSLAADKYSSDMLTEQNISLYQAWLIRMTGLSCTKEQAQKEMEFEISIGNEKDIKDRLESVLILKNLKHDSSITWQDVILEKGDDVMKNPNEEETYESFAVDVKSELDGLLLTNEFNFTQISLELQDKKWTTPGMNPISADHRALITVEEEGSQKITVDLMHVYCDYKNGRISKDGVAKRMAEEIHRTIHTTEIIKVTGEKKNQMLNETRMRFLIY